MKQNKKTNDKPSKKAGPPEWVPPGEWLAAKKAGLADSMWNAISWDEFSELCADYYIILPRTSELVRDDLLEDGRVRLSTSEAGESLVLSQADNPDGVAISGESRVTVNRPDGGTVEICFLRGIGDVRKVLR